MRKPKVTGYDGKYDKIFPDDRGGGVVEWQPGDGTRYLAVVKALGFGEGRILSASYPSFIVSVGPGDNKWLTLVTTKSLCHEHYIAEKADVAGIKITDYTIIALTSFINLIIGDEDYGVELFNSFIKR